MRQFNLEEYLANPSRKVVTRDGVEVRIIYTDFDREYPIVGTIKGHTFPTLFTEKGCYNSDGTSSPYDLFFAPEKEEKKEKHEGWVNVYKNGDRDYFTWIQVFMAGKRMQREIVSKIVSQLLK